MVCCEILNVVDIKNCVRKVQSEALKLFTVEERERKLVPNCFGVCLDSCMGLCYKNSRYVLRVAFDITVYSTTLIKELQQKLAR